MSHETIKGKDIYIVESHHQVLKAWEKYKGANLITFDHHTDTHEAFLRFAHPSNNPPEEFSGKEHSEIKQNLINAYLESKNIIDMINKLRFDEHISFAVEAGIINYAFVCSQDPGSGHDYEQIFSIYPKKNRYNGEKIIIYSIEEAGITDKNKVLRYDKFIDDYILKKVLCEFSKIHPNYLNNFILDFDMDYFHVERALSPSKHKEIDYLIKNSRAITIAKEIACSADMWEDKSPINHNENLDNLIKLIRNALD